MSLTALLAGLFSGLTGAMGLGGGSVLIIYLSLLTETEQITVSGVNLIFFIPVSALAVLIYAKRGGIKWKTVLPLCLWGTVGVAVGMLLSSLLGGVLLQKLFGGILIFMGLRETFSKGIEKKDG